MDSQKRSSTPESWFLLFFVSHVWYISMFEVSSLALSISFFWSMCFVCLPACLFVSLSLVLVHIYIYVCVCMLSSLRALGGCELV